MNDAITWGNGILGGGISKQKGPESTFRFEKQQRGPMALSRRIMNRVGDEVSCAGEGGGVKS